MQQAAQRIESVNDLVLPLRPELAHRVFYGLDIHDWRRAPRMPVRRYHREAGHSTTRMETWGTLWRPTLLLPAARSRLPTSGLQVERSTECIRPVPSAHDCKRLFLLLI